MPGCTAWRVYVFIIDIILYFFRILYRQSLCCCVCILSQTFPLLILVLWMAVMGAVATTGGGGGGTASVTDGGSKSIDLAKQTEHQKQQHAVLKRSFNPFYGGGSGNEWSGFAAPNPFQQWNK